MKNINKNFRLDQGLGLKPGKRWTTFFCLAQFIIIMVELPKDWLSKTKPANYTKKRFKQEKNPVYWVFSQNFGQYE